MADRSVVVRLKAEVNEYVAGMNKARMATKDFGSDVTNAAKSGDQGMQNLGRVALVTGGVLAAGFAKVILTAADFEKQMSGVKAVSGASAEEMGRLSEAAIDAGASTKLAGVTASDAARAESELVKAGVSVADVLGGGLMGSLTLASAGQLDFAKAAEIAAQAMNIFDLRGSQVTHVADVLAAAANKSAGDVGQFGDALRQGGLVASQTGLSLEETVGALAAFADNALLGSDAGTSLKTMLQRLTPQSEEAAALMDELGFSAYDAHGNFIGLEKLAGELQDSLGGVTVEQRNAAMATLFGSDAVRAANILYEEGAAGIKDYVDAVDDQGAAARMAAEQNNNLKGDIEALGGALESVFIENGSKATGMLRGLTQGITDAVTGFSEMPGPLQTVVGGIAALTGGVSLAVGGFVTLAPKFHEASESLKHMDGSLAKFAGNNLGKISAGIAGIGAALAAGSLIYEMATESSRKYEAEVKDLAAALAPVTEGQSDLNTEMENFIELQSADMSTGAVAAMNAFDVSLSDVQRSIRDGGDALDPFRDKVAELGIELDGIDLGKLDDAGAETQLIRLADALGISTSQLRELIDETEDWDNVAQDGARATIESAVANETFSQKAVDAAVAANTAKDGTINWAGALDDLAPKVQGAGTDAEGAAAGTGELTGGLEDAAKAAQEAKDRFQELQDVYRASMDPLFGMLDALGQNQAAQVKLNDAIKANNDDIKDNNVSAEEMAALYQDVAKSAMDVEVAARDLAYAVEDGTVSVDDARAMLAQWVAQGLMTEEQAGNVAYQFGVAAGKADEFAGDYVANVTTSGVDEASNKLSGLSWWLDHVNRSVTARVQLQLDNPYARVPGFQLGAASGGLIPQYLATGGMSLASGPRGTDTIPAWLSPGEYVVQKAAVDRFGIGFMDAVNMGNLTGLTGAAMPTGGTSDNSRHIGQLVVQTNASPRAWINEFLWQGAGL